MYLTKNTRTLLLLLLWRLSSVFIVQTAHVPDEYWQSLEVAHNLVYGYGYLTWEWRAKIRSYIYPFFVSVLYRILSTVHLDYAPVLITAPRMLHAILSAYADFRFYKWTRNKLMLFLLCINWYWYYCATRTLINSIETSFTIISLTMFPWRDSQMDSVKFLWISGLLIMARPTAAIIWMPLYLYHFCTSAQSKFTLVYQYCLILGTSFALSTLLDTYCYGAFTISSWEFFKVNVLRKIGDTYGKEHFLWYIFAGFPVLLGVCYILFFISIYQVFMHTKRFHRQAVMLAIIGWTISVYSLLTHKEFRFLLPLLPMLIYTSVSCTSYFNFRYSKSTRTIFLALLVVSNTLPGLYFSLVHQRGSLDVMKTLRHIIYDRNSISMDILFLTPCHATPLYSHLHTNVPVRFLTCEPNLSNSVNYVDEADEFFVKPDQWLEDNYREKEGTAMPNYIVMFDSITPRITTFLKNYQVVSKVFYAHFPQRNYGQYIIIYKHTSLNNSTL